MPLTNTTKQKKLLFEGTITDGVVIALIEVKSSDGNTYKPVFEYMDLTGATKTFTRKMSSNPPGFKIGDKAKLIYNSHDEKEIKIVSYMGLYGLTILFFSLALPLVVIGGGYFMYVKNL